MNYRSEQKVVEGYLQKQKRRIKNGQISSKRYFIFSTIDTEKCFIMKVRREDKSSTLKTYNASQIKGFSDKLATEEISFIQNSQYSFKIITTIKPYILCASTKEEFQNWIKILQKFFDGQNSQLNLSSSSSNSINHTQIEFQAIQHTQINLNSSSGNNTFNNNSGLKHTSNIETITEINSSNQDNPHSKKVAKNLSRVKNQNEEEKTMQNLKVESIGRKYIKGNSVGQNSGNGSEDFGTFGSSQKSLNNTNHQIYPAILRPEENNQSQNYLKSTATFRRETIEKNQISKDQLNVKNTINIVNTVNLSQNENLNFVEEENSITRQKEVASTSKKNSYNNFIKNHGKSQSTKVNLENFGEFQILSNNKNSSRSNMREEKGLIPLMECVKPLTMSEVSEPNSVNNRKIRGGKRELTFKNISGDSLKIGNTNFIADFSGQESFEKSRFTSKNDDDKTQFETINNKQHSHLNNSIENSTFKLGNIDNFGNFKGQYRQSTEKYNFMPQDATKLSVSSDSFAINQILMSEKQFSSKSNSEYSIRSKMDEYRLMPEYDNIPQTKPSEDFYTDFPKVITISSMKKKNTIREPQNTKIKFIVENNPYETTIFDKESMHIKRGIDFNNSNINLENLNFRPDNVYQGVKEIPSLPKKIGKNSFQDGNADQNLSKRKDLLIEENRSQLGKNEKMNEKMNENMYEKMQSNHTSNENQIREVIFSGRQNLKTKIIGQNDSNLPSGNKKKKKYLYNNSNISENNFNCIGKEIVFDSHHTDFIQENNKKMRTSMDNLAVETDFNHMNVQSTYQLDMHTVLQDEFHLPMDKAVNFQHKQTPVYECNHQPKSNTYLSYIQEEQSIILGALGELDCEKTFIEEINKINQVQLSNSFSQLDIEEDWNIPSKKENYSSRFEM